MESESAYLIGRRRDRCIRSLNEFFALLGRLFSAQTLGAAGLAEATSENVPCSEALALSAIVSESAECRSICCHRCIDLGIDHPVRLDEPRIAIHCVCDRL
jgi:hypothetical protein